jgi:uncharacterized repeat protein (TIGR04052 family)
MHKASMSRLWLGMVCLASLAATGCEETDQSRAISISFAAKVGNEPFSCSAQFGNLGTQQSTAQALDLRMYIHDVQLLRADGSAEPIELDQDGQWQRDSIAFLDFENGEGTCQTGSPETRTKITGQVPTGDYVGVAFSVGLPSKQNHLDAATAPAPLNIPGMWWSWSGGYKFVRLELRTVKNPTYFFHLGSTACEGTVKNGYSCAASNQAPIRLESFDPDRNTIVFDVEALLANSDLDYQIDPMNDGISGCMSFPGDPECPAMFTALGLTFEGQNAGSAPQTAFRVE